MKKLNLCRCFFSNFLIILSSINEDEKDCIVILYGIVIILIIALVFTLLVMSCKNHLHRSKLEDFKKRFVTTITNVAQSERAGVAKNLHDDISMPLNIIKLNLTKMSRNNCDKELSGKLINESLILLDQSVECIRNVAKKLSPPGLMQYGYVKGVANLCDQINASHGIKIEFIENTKDLRFPFPIELEAYRITNEILNNIMKYSGSFEIKISIESDEKKISTCISYMGFGLDSGAVDVLSETDKGVGLKSIQNRANMIGANIHYDMICKNQYKTTINVPCLWKEQLN